MAKKHLILLLHGLFGNANHMGSMAEHLRAQFADDGNVIVYVASSNQSLRTFDGISVGAERLYKELAAQVKLIIENGDSLGYISIVGYSLGGLFGRYLIGMLEEAHFFDNVQPVLYATFATPHAGTYFHSKRFRARILNFLGQRLLGVSGHQLFNNDDTLVRMADPSGIYIQGLRKFKRLVLFANSTHDRTVPFWTSYLTTKNPFRHLEHVELRFYDHRLGPDGVAVPPSKLDSPAVKTGQTPNIAETRNTRSASTSAAAKKAKIRPFLLAMADSKYSASVMAVVEPLLSRSERHSKRAILFMLPFLLPIVLAVLGTSTILSTIYVWLLSFRCKTPHSDNLLDEIRQAAMADEDALSESDTELVHRSPSRFNVGGFTEGAMEDVLETLAPGNFELETAGTELVGPPKAALNGGFAGLIDSTPFEMHIGPETREIIKNLNALPWQKFAVKLDHFNAHGEIVNRRQCHGQGDAVMKFFAQLAYSTCYCGASPPVTPRAGNSLARGTTTGAAAHTGVENVEELEA